VPHVGAADRLRTWGRKLRANPSLAVGIVWAFHVIRAGTGGNQTPSESDPDSADEVTETG
jgi:hypothetical protein